MILLINIITQFIKLLKWNQIQWIAEYNEDFNKKDPKFKVGDHVRISKYKNIFAKGYTQNWSEEVFVVSKIKNTVPWTYVISDLNGGPITGSFYEKELKNLVKKNSE